MRVLPDIEALLTGFLRSDVDVQFLAGPRVYNGDIPNPKTYPLVRLARLGGVPWMQAPVEIDNAFVQLDVWADTKGAAFELASIIRAAIAERFNGVQAYGEGVLTGRVVTVDLGSLMYLPDTTFDPSKPRYLLDMNVAYRPI